MFKTIFLTLSLLFSTTAFAQTATDCKPVDAYVAGLIQYAQDNKLGTPITLKLNETTSKILESNLEANQIIPTKHPEIDQIILFGITGKDKIVLIASVKGCLLGAKELPMNIVEELLKSQEAANGTS